MRVLLADSRVLFLEGLQSLLKSGGIDVAGTACGGPEIKEKARSLKPDAILMDITGNGDRLNTMRQIKAQYPGIKIIAFADSDENLLAAVKSGASGYLLTTITGEELLKKLKALEQGEAPFSPGLTARILEGFARADTGILDEASLTERQEEVLRLIARGMTYRQAGEALGLTERTVKYHMGKTLKRLGLRKKEQAVAYALKNERLSR